MVTFQDIPTLKPTVLNVQGCW